MPPERPQIPDYYEVLGIGFNASHDEVRVAWREAVKRWHPDLNRGDPSAAERMREVNEAWEVLGKPESRAAYNRNYFILQAAIAEAEREQHEQERLRAERQEEIRRREAEHRRHEEAAARRRQEEAERRRREAERQRHERAARAARERVARRRAEAQLMAEAARREAVLQQKQWAKEARARRRRERRAAGLERSPLSPLIYGAVSVIGVVIVVIVAITLGGAFESTAPQSPRESVSTRELAPVPATQVERGARLSVAAGCTACHSQEPGVQLFGPSFSGITHTAGRRTSQTADEYLLQSILEPDAFIVPSYTYSCIFRAVTRSEANDLVAFLKTIK